MENKKRDLSVFRRVNQDMVAKNDSAWNDWGTRHIRGTSYTLDEIQQILNSSSLEGLQKLSRDFYNTNGLYRKIILYYATVLSYDGLLIPHVSSGKKLSNSAINKRYYAALEYLDKVPIKEIFTRISISALIYGTYYGIIQTLNKNSFVLFDLPIGYCRSRYRDLDGNDIVEFNVGYFNTIVDEELRKDALNTYPEFIREYYKQYIKGKVVSPWVAIPAGTGLCFTFFDDGYPLLVNVIPSTLQYDDAVDNELEREQEEIRKIIVQKVPHLTDGALLFEPDEALEMHRGAVDMMRGNKNLSVLTTYNDVDAIVSKTSNDNASSSVEKMLQNVYSQAGVSMQIFSPTGTQALDTSVKNDISLMMILGNKYGHLMSYILNTLFGNVNVNFKYMFLPVGIYNQSDYLTDALKLAQSGYSFLLPSTVMGMSQSDLTNIKELETDVLKLQDLLQPLASSYTQSLNGPGAPKKKAEDKSARTIANEESLDHQGQSKGGDS